MKLVLREQWMCAPCYHRVGTFYHRDTFYPYSWQILQVRAAATVILCVAIVIVLQIAMNGSVAFAQQKAKASTDTLLT